MDVVTKLQHRSSSPPRDFIFSRIPFSPRKGENSHTKLWIFFSAAVSIAVFLYLLLASKRINSPRFSIIIDAGSTGTRLHVFSFVISPKTKLPVLDLASTSSLKVRPGLSSYSGDPSSAGDSLVDLLRFGKGKVPRDQWGDTEVRLMATAGLRMLDAGVTDSILESCRMALRSSGFLFQDEWATVISGSEEGVFAWVAANYALGMLGGDPLKTNGIIELGGASAQITFATEEALPSELAHVVKFGEATYKLYSNSFLHFGQNVAQESVKELLSSRSAEKSPTSRVFIDPCSPRGYSYSVMSPEASTALPISTVEDHSISHASGNFSECKSAALLLLKQENGKCLRQECRFGSNYIPKLQGRFLATENFFFTSEFFGLGSVPVLSDFESAGQHFCEEDWDNLKYKYQTFEADDFARYCFSSAYIVALLHDNLGIPMDDKSRLWFANQVDGIHLDWALGAFILQTKEHLGWAASIFHFNFFSLLGIITVFLLLMFFIWLMLRLQKPQLKTVYDLEKGRYIDLYIEEANFASAITHPLSIA